MLHNPILKQIDKGTSVPYRNEDYYARKKKRKPNKEPQKEIKKEMAEAAMDYGDRD